jgi:excinuclease ABC subunit C
MVTDHPAVALLPTGPGVYRFRAAGGRTLYIGRASDLRRRVASYWGRLRDRPHLRRMVPQVDRIEAVACDSEHEAAWLERNLLEHALPRWNRTEGTESPVYIGLGRRFEVSHDATPYGPYLGGTRVRLAVAGLDRVIPLAYAGSPRGGFDRDLARVLGLAGATREELTATAVSVLEGDARAATWARAALAERRDGAARALAFELAARIQAELEALEWVLAEQKVTRVSTEQAEVHGYADGLLVTFQIRDGRIRVWTQRPTAAATAAGKVDRTPPDWREFAARNALLAARLAAAGR